MAQPTPVSDEKALRAAVAFVWLATGLAVLHPSYRDLGRHYLAPLGLPDAVMYAACAAEVTSTVAAPARR